MSAELAAQLVARLEWRWMPGMLMISTGFERERWMVCWADLDNETSRWSVGAYQTSGGKWWGIAGSEDTIDPSDGWLPDLTDAATVGCMLEMLDDATSHEVGAVTAYSGGWCVEDYRDHGVVSEGPTLGAAVARALLAAWGAR